MIISYNLLLFYTKFFFAVRSNRISCTEMPRQVDIITYRGIFYLFTTLGKVADNFIVHLLLEPIYHHKAEWHHPRRRYGDHS